MYQKKQKPWDNPEMMWYTNNGKLIKAIFNCGRRMITWKHDYEFPMVRTFLKNKYCNWSYSGHYPIIVSPAVWGLE